MGWEKMKTIWIVLILANIVIGTLCVVKHVSKDKPHCYVCDVILWTQHAQNQLGDTWTCNDCWKSAKKLAMQELGYIFANESGHRVDYKLKNRIYEIIKKRR